MKLWVTAGGTGSAWHISNIVKKYFADKIELYISDINDKELVASASLADYFFKVPLATSEGYSDYMYKLLKDNQIDVIIPLIPWEQEFFSEDNEEFAKLNVKTAAPNLKLSDELNNKVGLNRFCRSHDIPTIEVFEQYNEKDIIPDRPYFVKPVNGFGASGAKKVYGCDLTKGHFEDYVVQEYCEGPEITVEAFYDNGQLHTIARERIEAKSGVCTKARILKVPEAEAIVKTFTEYFNFPKVFNIQFIKKDNVWKVMDINLRLAAGTGLSNAAGFQMIRAYLTTMLGEKTEDSFFNVDYGIVSILRVYQEVVIR